DDGGMNGDTVWIDTEQTFRPERIRHMADALDLDADAILKRIHVARAFNSHHQMLLVEKAQELTQDFPIRLIVIDSLTAHFRAGLSRRACPKPKPSSASRRTGTATEVACHFVSGQLEVSSNPLMYGVPWSRGYFSFPGPSLFLGKCARNSRSPLHRTPATPG